MVRRCRVCRLSSALLQTNVLVVLCRFEAIQAVEASEAKIGQGEKGSARGMHVVDPPRVCEAGCSRAVDPA